MHSLRKTWEKAKALLGTETGVIILLLSVVSYFYSSLLKAGIAQDCLIALLCDDWKDAKLIHEQIRVEEDNHPLPMECKRAILWNSMEANRDDVSLFLYHPYTSSERNLQWLLSELTDNAALQRAALPSVAIVAFKDVMPFDDPEKILLCKLPDCGNSLADTTPILSELEAYAQGNEDRILRPLQEFLQTPLAYQDKRWLYAAAYLLSYMNSDLTEGAILQKEWLSALDAALRESDRLKDVGGLSPMFLDCLNQYIGLHPDRVISRGRAAFQSNAEAHTVVLYDENRCYIPDEVFSELCAELQDIACVQQINRALLQDHIQLPEKIGESWKNTQSIPIRICGAQKRSRYHVLVVNDSMCPNLRKASEAFEIEEVEDDAY